MITYKNEISRQCPACGNKIVYRGKDAGYRRDSAHKKKKACKSCAAKIVTDLELNRRIDLLKNAIPLALASRSKEWREKQSKANRGQNNPRFGIPTKHSPESRKRMRLVKTQHMLRNGIAPRYNSRACEFFDKLNAERGWNGKHATNGGEFYVSNLGYFLDFYDAENNIVVEYDEARHYFADGKLRDKDRIRQNEIIEKLKCRFFRYNSLKMELSEVKCST